MKLILASNSRTRKEVLDKVGVRYEVIPSNIVEKSNKSDPLEYMYNPAADLQIPRLLSFELKKTM